MVVISRTARYASITNLSFPPTPQFESLSHSPARDSGITDQSCAWRKALGSFYHDSNERPGLSSLLWSLHTQPQSKHEWIAHPALKRCSVDRCAVGWGILKRPSRGWCYGITCSFSQNAFKALLPHPTQVHPVATVRGPFLPQLLMPLFLKWYLFPSSPGTVSRAPGPSRHGQVPAPRLSLIPL